MEEKAQPESLGTRTVVQSGQEAKRRASLRIGILAGAFLLAAIIVGTLFYLAGRSKTDGFVPLQQTVSNQTLGQVKNLPLEQTRYTIQGDLKVTSNATTNNLTVDNNLILGKTTPVKPVAGQLYFDGSGLKFYNGQNVQSLGAGISSLGGSTGDITLGNGLNLVNGVLSAQTPVIPTGTANLQAGAGINISGGVITSTGVTSVSGTSGQVSVSGSTGNVVIGLPQSIAVTSSPAFAGLTLGSPLAITSGGTGASSAAAARAALGSAASGNNTDITTLAGLTTALAVNEGGTGLQGAPTAGQLLVGNGTGYNLSTITAGSGITVTNNAGSITIAASGAGTCASCADQSLGNLSGVAINTSLLPASANSIDAGSAAAAFRNGYFGTSLQTPTLDSLSGALAIGTTNATAINLNQDTTVASGKTLTVLGSSSFGGLLQGTSASFTGASALTLGSASNFGAIGFKDGTVDGFTLTLQPGTLTANRTYTLPNSTTANDTVCLQVLANCNGGAVGGSGTVGTIALFTASAAIGNSALTQSGNNVTGAGSLIAATSLLAPALDAAAPGVLTVGGTNAAAIDLNQTTVVAAGKELGVGVTPNYPLDVAGDANITGSYRINGTVVCSASGCTPDSGSGSYIQNGTTSQAADFNITGTGTAGTLNGTTVNGTTISGATVSASTSVQTPTLDSLSGALAIGTTNATAINLNQDTTVASGKTLTVLGSSSFGGLLQGITATFSGSNSITLGSTTNLGAAVFKDGTADGFTLALQPGTLTASRTYTLPNSTAATDEICLVALGNCAGSGGGVTGTGTSGTIAIFTGAGVIGNSTLTQSGGNVSASGSLIAAGSLLAPAIDTSAAGALTIGGANATAIDLNQTTVVAAGKELGVGAVPNYPLDVAGDINSSTGLRVAGTLVCTANGCTPAAGSGNYIQNGTTQQTADFNISGTGTAGTLNAATVSGATISGTTISGTTVSASTSLQAPTLDSLSGALAIGTTNATAINLNQDTTVASGKTLTVLGSSSFGGLLQGSTAAFSGANAITLGSATNLGAALFKDGTADGFVATLNTTTLTASHTITIPDATGTICLSTGNCPVGGGSGNYIQNGTVAQTADFNITGTGTAGTVHTSTLDTAAAGVLAVGGANATAIDLNQDTLLAASKSLGIGAAPSYPLDVTGDINSSTGLRVGGTLVCTASGCSAGSGSGNYIQNGTTQQTADFNISGTGTAETLNATTVSGTTVSGTTVSGTTVSASSTLQAPTLDSLSGALAIGTTNATAINLNQDTTVASGKTLTVLGSSSFGGLLQGSTAAFSGANSITLGSATNLGSMLFKDGTSDGFALAIQPGTLTASRTYTLPNSTAATDEICLVTLGNCAGSGGGVTGSGTAGTIAVFTAGGAVGDSTLTQSGGNVTASGNLIATAFQAPLLDTVSAAALQIGTTNATAIDLNQTTVLAAGKSLGIGAAPGYPLDVTGDINTTTALRIAGVTVCSASGCTPSAGSGNYIQNGTIAQTADFNITGNAIAATFSGTTATLTGTNSIVLGSATNLGGILYKDGTGDGFTLGLQPATLTATRTYTLPDSTATTDTVCLVTLANCSGANGGSGNTNYIFNQTSQQASSNFNISGTGIAAVALQAPSIDAATAAALILGGTNATSIVLAKDASTSAGKNFSSGGNVTASGNITATGNVTGTIVKATTTLQAPALDTASAGALTIGSTNATAITLDQNTTVAQGKTLQVGTNGTATGQLYVGGVMSYLSATEIGGTKAINDIKVLGKYAYVASQPNGSLTVFDVSKPSVPVQLGSLAVASTEGMDVAGRYAYITSCNGSLLIADISNPSSPMQVGSISLGVSKCPNAVRVSGKYAYVQDNASSTLWVVDVSDPAKPTLVTSIAAAQSFGYDSITLVGSYLYEVSSSDLTVVDISNQSNPLVKSSTSLPVSGPSSVAVSGKYAFITYVASGAGGLLVYDVSDPSDPALVKNISTGLNAPIGITLAGRTAYVVESGGKAIDAFDISDPANPAKVYSAGAGLVSPDYVRIAGRYAYIVDGSNGLVIYDLGGTYTSSLQAGSAETGALAVDDAATFAAGVSIQGSLAVGQAAQFDGDLGVAGAALFVSNVTVQGAGGLSIGVAGTTTGVLGLANAANSNVVTITTASQANAVALTIPADTHATDTVCLQTLANCSGGALGGSGTAGKIALFTGTGVTVGDSALTQTGSDVAGAGAISAATSLQAPTVTATTTLQAPLLDTASAVALNIGTTNATAINLNQNTTVASGKYLQLTGGTTRPASPNAGTLFYDTSTSTLLTYNGAKWTSASRSATKIVAASNSTQAEKDAADYVASGTGDQATINSALTALPAGGGSVYLMEGTYTISAAISVPNNTTLSGAGAGTIITLPNAQNGTYNMIQNTDTTTGTNVVVSNLLIDGNLSHQTSGSMNGIYLNHMGGGSGATARAGAKISNVSAKNLRGSGVAGLYLVNSNNNVVSGSGFSSNSGDGITVDSSSNNTIANNTVQGNGANGISVYFGSSYNTITGNVSQGNSEGMLVQDAHNTITGNTVQANTYQGIENDASNNTITGNTVSGNGWQSLYVGGGNNNTITGNNISDGSVGILLAGSNNNDISGNKIYNSGGSTDNEGISVSSSSSNTITGNDITDSSCTSTCRAINISDSGSNKNYLSNNSFSGDGTHAATIQDLGTGTVYANQLNSTGQLINSTPGALVSRLQAGASNDLLQAQNSSGSVLFGVSDTGLVNSAVGYSFNGTAGSTTSCSSGNVLQNAVIQGGIITGGTCVANGGGVVTSLQDAYNNSSTVNPQIQLSTANGGLKIRDASTTVGNILQVQDSAGSSTYFAVTSSGINATGGTFSGNLVVGNIGGNYVELDNSGLLTAGVGSFQNLDMGSGAPSLTVSSGLSGAGIALRVGGSVANTASRSLIQIGNAIQGGNSATNGGTYLGLNAPSTGAGSAADFLNLQRAGTTEFQVDSAGNVYSPAGFTTGTASIQGGDISGASVSSVLGYSFNGTAGKTTTCATGEYLGAANIQGGIITNGSCVASLGGSGTAGKIAVFTGTGTTIGSSALTQSGSDVTSAGALIGTTTLQAPEVDTAKVSGSNNLELDANSALSLDAQDIEVGGGGSTVNVNGAAQIFNTATIEKTSGTALLIQNTGGASTLLAADTSNMRVSVGSLGAATGQLYVGGTLSSNVLGSVAAMITPVDVKVQGNIAYVASDSNSSAAGIGVYNVANPASPQLLKTISYGAGQNPKMIETQGHYLYVEVGSGDGMDVYDISDPANPVWVSNTATNNGGYMSVSGRYAFTVDSSNNTIDIIDVSNPASPKVLSTLSGFNYPQAAVASGHYLYVDDRNNGTVVEYDITNPSSPQRVTDVAVNSNRIQVVGNYLYAISDTSNTLNIVNISNHNSLSVVGTMPGNPLAGQSVFVQGHYVYSAGEANGIQIVDVSNPASPLFVGNISGVSANSLFVIGRYAYATDDATNMLDIFDLGGAYIQQLEAGGVQSSTLDVAGNASVGGDTELKGNLAVGQNLNVQGTINASTLQVATSSPDTAVPQIAVKQAGTGDATIALGTASQNWFIGSDGSDSGTLKISSSTASGSQTATLGYSTVGATTDTGDSNAATASSYVAAHTGPITSMSVYIGSSIGASPNNKARLGIYADNGSDYPGPLLNQTAEFALVAGWNTVTLPSTELTAGATYWLAYNTNGTTSGVNDFNYDNSATLTYGIASTYGAGGLTSTFPASAGTWSASPSIYATYNSSIYDDLASSLFNLTGAGQATFQNSTNSSAAFKIQNSTAGTLLNADTTNMRVSIGTGGTATGQLYVAGSTPTAASASLTMTTTTSPNGIAISGNYAYVIGNSKIQAFDVSSQTSTPIALGSAVSTGTTPSKIIISGHYAYVTNKGSSTLQIFDISNPYAITLASTTTLAGSAPAGLYVQGRYAYIVDDTTYTLESVDISNPNKPVLLSHTGTGVVSDDGGANTLAVQGRYAYIADKNDSYLYIYDISNPTTLPGTYTGRVLEAGGSNLLVGVAVSGRYAYLIDENNHLQTIDVSNPSLPATVGSRASFGSGGLQAVSVQGNYVYALNYTGGIGVFDVTTTSPQLVSSITGSTGGWAMAIQGRYIYLVNHGTNTLQVLDFGGEYTQLLQAGSAEVGNLQVDNNANFAADASIQGGLQIGQSLQVSGNIGASGQVSFANAANSANAFQIQTAGGVALLNANTTAAVINIGTTGSATQAGSNLYVASAEFSGAVRVGNATNNVQFNGTTFEPTLNGTSRHTKSIVLTAEYAGAVLDAGGDAPCVSASSGTITSGLATGLTGFGNTTQNYYKWVTTNATSQCYDVVVQVPVPSDFSAWTSSNNFSINGYTADTTNGTVNYQIQDSTGHVDQAYTPMSFASAAWTNNTTTATLTGTYTPGSYLTIRVRLSATSAVSAVEVGNITLNYLSKF